MMRRVLLAVAALALAMATMPAMAQDAVKVDPQHYKVEFENEHVRVLRITYGPGEKSVMHSHPANVAVSLTGGQWKMTMADGKTQEVTDKAGQVMWNGGGDHLPENVGGKAAELILVELKGK